MNLIMASILRFRWWSMPLLAARPSGHNDDQGPVQVGHA
jgi:hypothetical protein